ncbi:acyl-CoA dehydrogenase [Defluviimonas sp. WL0024]|uniref:Acyl-CoA dehydrogenase n=2 Tax=Albidovulum TaxID=205889 RepID=A0ABT3IZ72_9RHOB|nr:MULTISPECIES: acyl-CoA dehydrogenase [Defluviimonas]MCU9848280.1 acyl-CoA dehydrogenase [Defluviimonas sp. WL0024]MCW3780734.1 acyl-CoA dehydrogenase [Defluviimonas salinarum]
MPYRSPVTDIRFILDHVVLLAPIAATDRFGESTGDLAEAILTEAAKLCDTALAPVQRAGDLTPARLENGVVRTSPGYAEAYAAIRDGGWVSVSAPAEHGGMDLPQTLNMAIHDMMSGACLSLQLLPLMTQGQIEALDHHASDALKALYLPKLVSGEWAGTMNLTEAQAGSDVGALRTRAEPNGDGTYAITGQKIFISWGDNDFTGNVCHLVLARLPGAVAGTKGISLFLVPKFLPDADGQPGAANAVKVVSLEHKMGLHGSPTCVMAYEGATGWLVGQEHRGMAAMFTMMNNARLGVAMQGIGVAEAACQAATEYAAERQQFGPIIGHADVRRMLGEMRADTFAARSIALACAQAIDMGTATGEADWAARAAFLTPIAKAFGTATGIRVAETAMQVHGGMGFIEETGVAQFYRDVRVTAIYEGTNGIQAMDLVGRKLADGGEAAFRLLEEIEAGAEAARGDQPDLAGAVWAAAETLREATEWMVGREGADRNAGATAYLEAFARVLGAHYHLKAAMAEGGTGPRAALARFYIGRRLPLYAAHLAAARDGAEAVLALTPEALSS